MPVRSTPSSPPRRSPTCRPSASVRRHTLLRWSLFFLISVGRGTGPKSSSRERPSVSCTGCRGSTPRLPFQVKTVEAMQHRRVAVREMRRRGLSDEQIEASPIGRGFGIRDGNGIIFIGHDGVVQPSGFMPLALGRVPADDIVEIYRHHPDLVALRDVTQYKGRCGRCSYPAGAAGRGRVRWRGRATPSSRTPCAPTSRATPTAPARCRCRAERSDRAVRRRRRWGDRAGRRVEGARKQAAACSWSRPQSASAGRCTPRPSTGSWSSTALTRSPAAGPARCGWPRTWAWPTTSSRPCRLGWCTCGSVGGWKPSRPGWGWSCPPGSSHSPGRGS